MSPNPRTHLPLRIPRPLRRLRPIRPPTDAGSPGAIRYHRLLRLGILCAVLTGLGSGALAAQEPSQGAPPPADPADVATQDAIIAAVYDAISGPAGEARNWDRFLSLFVPGARLIPVRVPQDGPATATMITPAEYAEMAGPALEARGFFEVETHRVTEGYGHLAHAFSTYESRNSPDDPEPFARGINSFQLLWDGARWWVVTIYWDAERPGQEIPARYGG